jgi:hypothetical protein
MAKALGEKYPLVYLEGYLRASPAGAEYATLRKYFSHPSFSYVLFLQPHQ